MAYNRDLQEDKRIVFHADDTLAASVDAMAELLAGIEFRPPPPAPETVSLDLAEALVGRGVPFREAHQVIGRLVARLEESGLDLGEASGADLVAIDTRLSEEDLELLDPATSPSRRQTEGSGSPASVRSQVAQIRSLLA
jgi:argininosuccinate lyase